MSLRIIAGESEFSALQPAWRELFLSNSSHGPYQSWEWNYSWWRHHGDAADLRLMLVEEQGRLIGIAPLQFVRRFRGLPLRHLQFIAHKRANYTDFVVRPGFEAVFFRQLFAQLQDGRRNWDFLEIRDLPAASPNLPFIREQGARSPLLLHAEPGETCVTLPLAATLAEFLERLSKHFRKDLRYYRRSFERSFTCEFRAVSEPGAIAPALNDFITVYNQRWGGEPDASGFDHEATARFERELANMLAARSMYQLFLLYGNDKPAAGILAYVHNNRCYVERFAHSPEFHKHSVGTVLLAMSVEHAIGRGWTELDLMRGAEAYKMRWGGRETQNLRVRIFRTRRSMRLVSSIDRIYMHAARVRTLQGLLGLYKRWRRL